MGGWVYAAWVGGLMGFGASILGTAAGLALLWPAYAIGGMGAGDVKLLAGVGAWVGATTIFFAFCVSAVFGGVIALLMVLVKRKWEHHYQQFFSIVNEIMAIRDADKLAAIAAERKPSMLLLPYGIPIAMGTIAYFLYAGMLFS
jgi:prepilin peptidase CpaA